MLRRDVLGAVALAGGTMLAGCGGRPGGDEAGTDEDWSRTTDGDGSRATDGDGSRATDGDGGAEAAGAPGPGIYRQWLALETGGGGPPGAYVVHADAIAHRGTAERIWTGATGTLLLAAPHGTCFSSTSVNAVSTTADADAVASFVLDEGGTRLDVALPDGYAAVSTPTLSMPVLATPDGGVWSPELRGQDSSLIAERFRAFADKHRASNGSYSAETKQEETFLTLTRDAGVPDVGHFEVHSPDGSRRAAAEAALGLSVAIDVGSETTTATVSVLFAASGSPAVEAARAVLEARAGEFATDPFAEFGAFSGTTEGPFARLTAKAPTSDYESN